MADDNRLNQSPVFEEIKKTDENGEFWLARELSTILEYTEYAKFISVIRKAITACENSGQQPRNHFSRVSEMVPIGSGAKREIDDVRLTRYACYLIVQNASSDKAVVALGQTYFAVQTRLQEIQQMEEYEKLGTEEERRLFLRKELTEHNKQLMTTAKSAGVIDPIDYAVFQNYGYKGLYGGLDRKGIAKKKGLAEKSNILDHMGSTELAANLFRATQAEEKLKREKIQHKVAANKAHLDVGKKVRDTIKEIGGTMPEDLPVAENIKLLEGKSKKNLPKNDKL